LTTKAASPTTSPGTSTTTTTTSTTTTTTTTPPAPSVARSAGDLVAAIDGGVTNGTIAPQAGQQLLAQLQPLLLASRAGAALQPAQPFDQLVRSFYQDVGTGQIVGDGTVRSLTSALGALSVALGTPVPSVTSTPPTSSTPTPQGPPYGPGGRSHGHGHGPPEGH
jgi:hypothetical protein